MLPDETGVWLVGVRSGLKAIFRLGNLRESKKKHLTTTSKCRANKMTNKINDKSVLK